MIRLSRTALAVTTLCSLGLGMAMAGPAHAQAVPPVDEAQRQMIESVVQDYLLNNPEIILQSLQAMKEREEKAAAAAAAKALIDHREELVNDKNSPVGGNPKGDVTVVEFFDYQCGYCKSVQADVIGLMKADSNVRFVYKEFPILGPASVIAAKAALAARAQGKYEELHNGLMAHRGQLDEPTIMRLAKSVGLDTDRLKKDMEDDKVTAQLGAVRRLAEALRINGTPAFVIGDELAPGALRLDDLKTLVQQARKG